MRKVLSIRAEESTHKDLKVLAAMRELSIGDLLDALVKEEMGRLKRSAVTLLGDAAEQSRMEKPAQPAPPPVTTAANSSKKKKKKRR